MIPQVAASHYEFSEYVNKPRWASYWHQIDEIVACRPESVIEVGGGGGILRAILRNLGIRAETVDLDSALKPDHRASVTSLPFADGAYDIAACFQVLEHLPFDQFHTAAAELSRVSRRYVVISLPNAATRYRITFQLPRLGTREFFIRRPFTGRRQYNFNGEHYWELGTRGYTPERIIKALEVVGLTVIRTYRVSENSYHQFFVCRKSQVAK